MGQDGVPAVHDAGIVATFIEHAEVDTQRRGKVDGTVHAAFIGGDDDHVLFVEADVRGGPDEGLQHLIDRRNVFKAVQRDGVADTGVVGVEGEDGVDTVIDELLQHHGAVEGLTVGLAVLSAFIKHGHDDRDTAGFAVDGSEDALQVGVVVVRTHGDFHAAHLVSDSIVEGVDEDEQVITADGLLNDGLGFARGETGGTVFDEEGVLRVAGDVHTIVLAEGLFPPVDDVFVDLGCEFFCAFHGDDTQFSVGDLGKTRMLRDVCCHG